MIEYIKAAVIFAAGIYLGERICAGFAVIFMLSLIMVLTIKAVFKHKFDLNILIAAVIFTSGIFLYRCATDITRYDLYKYTDRYVTLEGRVNDIPATGDGDENVQYIVDVRTVEHEGKTEEVHENVLLTAAPGFRYGDTVTFSGFLEKVNLKMNSNGFDYAKYCKGKGVFFKMYTSNLQLSVNTVRDYSPYAWGMYLKSFVCDAADEMYSGDYSAIMKAVLAGNRKEFSEEFEEVLIRTGLHRFYYPAFLHVMLFMAVISFALGAVGKRKRDIVTVFLLILYAAVNFQNAVFLKLALMTALLIFLKYRFGRVYYLDVIGMTALIMGVINPLVYFDVGFIMSMLSSIFIYYFFDTVYARLKFIGVKYIRRLTAIGLICTVGLIPITAYFFNEVSFYSVCVSFIMLPCAFVLLVLSPPLIAMQKIFGAAPIVKQAANSMLFILKYIPIWIDKARFLHLSLAKPDTLFLIIYLFLTVGAVKYTKNKKSHARLALFIAAALAAGGAASEAERLNDLEITFVNVGQGDGAYISAPHRFNVLIDGGGGNEYSDYNPGEKVYLAYLKTEGINDVDSAFVSHYHKDHVQGIIAAVENINVRNLFLPDEMEGGEWRTALEKAANERGTKIHYISEETLIRYNNGMTVRAIPPAPLTRISDDENDTSYIYLVEYGGFSAMFTGDMSAFAEKALLNNGKVPRVDLLKIAHHGSDTSTSKEWVEALAPRYAVISLGENNEYGFPNDTVLENLSGAEVYRTDYDGDIRFVLEKDGIEDIETFNRKE